MSSPSHHGRESQSERTVPLVRGLRAQLGLTQAQLAARANVCRATVRDAERGARQPQRTTAIALADALGFPPASVFPDLFGQEDRCVCQACEGTGLLSPGVDCECPTPDDHEPDLLTVYMAGHQHGQDADAGWRARALTAEKDLAEAERLLQRGYEDGDWKRVGAFLARHNKKNPE